MHQDNHPVPKLRFREPKRNLPGRSSGRTTEDRFTYEFAQVYMRRFSSLHHRTPKTSLACAREIPVNGFGIADLVTVAWKPKSFLRWSKATTPDMFMSRARPTIRSFEVKLTDWRRAMRQANRYRYFSNTVIVVLPSEKCAVALENIDTFRMIDVGLWTFDAFEKRITIYFTPRPFHPLDRGSACRALELVAKASRVLPGL